MAVFSLALFLLCASTLGYEVVLTRLLSVVCWYYLAFVSVSMAMFGMTAGALAVQLRPDWFPQERIHRNIAHAAFAMAVSMPLSLMTMLAVPVDIAYAVESLYSFLLLSAIISVPFFFAGVVVCLSLTKTSFPIGTTYFADMVGGAAGCLLSAGLLRLTDAPSAVFAISALLFASAALYYLHAGDRKRVNTSWKWACALLAVAALNSATLYGIQPTWAKGARDRRTNLLAEIWNPISKVRALKPQLKPPQLWGPSPTTPHVEVEEIVLDIDNDAETPITKYQNDLTKFDYLGYQPVSKTLYY